MDNYYELDIKSQLLQIRDCESREVTEEIFLMNRVCRVTTTLGKELR